MSFVNNLALGAVFAACCLCVSCDGKHSGSGNKDVEATATAEATTKGVENEPLEQACKKLGFTNLLRPGDKPLKIVRLPGMSASEVSLFPEAATVGVFIHDGFYFSKTYPDCVLSIKNVDGEENGETSYNIFSDFVPGGEKKGELRLLMKNSAKEELIVLIYNRAKR